MQVIESAITGNELVEAGTPLGALSEFYQAFNNRNLDLMRRNWDQEECVLDNPLGGIRRGWQEIEPLYQRIFTGSAQVKVAFYDYTIHQSEGMFCATGRERGSFEKRGTHIDLAIRTTRIYRHVDGRWRQIHHHGSIEDPKLLATYQAAVLET
jgi:ketosteroid isomerase-like protein